MITITGPNKGSWHTNSLANVTKDEVVHLDFDLFELSQDMERFWALRWFLAYQKHSADVTKMFKEILS